MYSTIGDLPVPPVERFPTHITGKLKDDDLRIFKLYNMFLHQITAK
jgi:hypothetical protein